MDLLLSDRTAAHLARESGWADEVLYVPEKDWYEGLSAVRFMLTTIRPRGYDAVLRTFLTAPSMARVSLACFFSGARVRAAFGTPGANAFETHVLELDESKPEIERHLALASAVGVEVRNGPIRIKAPDRGRLWAEEFLSSKGLGRYPLLGLHPGSDARFSAKRWAAERFGDLARLAKDRLGMEPVVLGGPDDSEAIEEVIRASGREIVAVRGPDIVEVFGLIERCTAFVSNDSGLMHIASALGIPTLALFGPTDPVKNRPLGARTQILRLGLDCSPCDRDTATNKCGHRNCLNLMQPRQVMSALQELVTVGQAE